VEDLDPIKQLQSLIDDRGKVLEKISSIHSALGSIIKTSNPITPAPQAPPQAVLATENKSIQIAEDRRYDRLLQTLHDMQAQIEERVRPLAQQTIEIEVARLREMSKQDQTALLECLERIDQCILSCMEHIREYQERHSELTRLNQRLATLGAEPQPLPDLWPAQDAGEMIRFRLEELRLQGKI
jgi:DNA repair exonuclease SbcCD ATPase subunit